MTTPVPPKEKPNTAWSRLVWIVPGGVLLLVAVVFAAKGARELETVQAFLASYPGHSPLPAGAPVGFPAWLGWQHFLNMFFLVLIVRSGWLVRTNPRPQAFWTRKNTGRIRTKNPPKKISLDLWAHLAVDSLWVLNGAIFYVLLAISGQWMRVVPTSWDVIPNALSAALQYASLDWPIENGWNNYNGLQLLAYCLTIFVAAPLAILSGLRMSGAWPASASRMNKIYRIEVARAVHFPVMIYFVFFSATHVALVLTTGALKNLNHMYAANDQAGWLGFALFIASLIVTAAAWIAMRPVFLRPLSSLSGKVTR